MSRVTRAFIGYYDRSNRDRRSGEDDISVYSATDMLFHSEFGVKFKHYSAWLVLRESMKFRNLDPNNVNNACRVKQREPMVGSSVNLEDDGDEVNNAAESGVIYVDVKKFTEGGFGIVSDENVDLAREMIEEPYELGEECLKTNYYGTKRITEALVPLLDLSKSPRIVNVSSAYGDLHWFHNEKLKEELFDIERLTEERIDEIIEWFLRDLKEGKLRENGWPLTCSAYKVSKAGMNAYTRLMARKFKKIIVNCVHPGYVVTDMSCNTGFYTAEEGAKGPVMAALLPDDGPSGAYFDRMELVPFTMTKRGIS